jgi:4-hydroxy-tetrahydrodipicolinate synthase
MQQREREARERSAAANDDSKNFKRARARSRTHARTHISNNTNNKNTLTHPNRSNPYYGKTSHAGLRAHFAATLAEGPAIVYNVPGRTGQDIPDEIILELAGHPSLLGVKECTGNARIAAYAKQGISCWSGNDDEAHDARHGSGAAGVISVTSNLIPGLFDRMMNGPPDPELAASLNELIAWLFCEPNPIPLNTALMMCGLIQPVFRLPYVPLSRAQRERGAELLRRVQQHIPGCKEVRVMEDDEFRLVGRY